MKNSFRVFALMLVALFAIAFVGCGGDDEDEAMDELTGKYTATEIEVEVDGSSIVVRPPDLFGQLNLNVGGGSWSMNYVFDGGDKVDHLGYSWSANGTILSLDGDPTSYAWDGTYLTFSTSDGTGLTVHFKWQKL